MQIRVAAGVNPGSGPDHLSDRMEGPDVTNTHCLYAVTEIVKRLDCFVTSVYYFY